MELPGSDKLHMILLLRGLEVVGWIVFIAGVYILARLLGV